VASRIPDREQDRPAAAFGFRERVGTPGPPGDGIVLMLQQVRACLLSEAVFVRSGSVR